MRDFTKRSTLWPGLRPALGAFLAALAIGGVAGSEEGEPLRDTMQRVLSQLEVVLPASVDRDAPMTAAQRADFVRGIEALQREADAVDRHAADQDLGFRHLSGSLATDLAEVRRHLDRGEDEAARYYLVQATSNCVACHARLPGAKRNVTGEQLYARVAGDAKSVHERAQLLVATRQFDRAIAEWEALFADPSFSVERLDSGGYLLDYLTIQVRVLRDRVRPQGVLHAVAQRADTPAVLRAKIEGWRASLVALPEQPDSTAGGLLSTARALIAGVEPGEDGLIEDLEASALLLQHIDGLDEDDPSLGEAFYLLGIVEARNVEGYWLPMTDAHLEAAVRVDPRGAFATPAYDRLAAYWIEIYGAETERDLPQDQQERLAALQELIEPPRDEVD